MKRDILIVDDDQQFTSLLRGIFEQAGYSVQSAHDAADGLALIQKRNVDLLVLDQRLPGNLSGSDMIEKLREMNSRIPVIMVSGFLNDDAIRDLIRSGVRGVFIKPLNIFSLLKKASEILEEESAQSAGEEGSTKESHAGGGGKGAIGGIRGFSNKGQEFMRRAHDAASFKRNLLLIGPQGTLFEEIGKDILSLSSNAERCIVLKPGTVTQDNLHKPFAEKDGDTPVAFIILEAEQLSVEEVDRLIGLVDEKGGSSSSLRMIFCLSQTVEDLYDAEKIDEELYLFLGTNELVVPPLREMPEDLLAIAKDEVSAHFDNFTPDAKLRSLLLDHKWPENMLELRSVVVRAITHAQPSPPSARHFERALHPDKSEGEDSRTSLERFLDLEKRRYCAALDILGIS